MSVHVYFVERAGWTLVVYFGARRGVYLRAGWSLTDVGVGAIARIYLDEMVGHSFLSATGHSWGRPCST